MISGHLSYFSCSLDIMPWFLAYDYPTNAVILCVRGTKSFANVLTDLLSSRDSLYVATRTCAIK